MTDATEHNGAEAARREHPRWWGRAADQLAAYFRLWVPTISSTSCDQAIFFIGPPGVGKTMLSVALARAAAEAGHKVLFTTCEDLVRRLRRAIAEHRFPSGLRFFTTPRLLVIDELGYRILDEESRSLLFEVINARYLKGSIITTSHVGIASWAERPGDPLLAAATLDRLLHRGVIVGIDGPSYRMRAHQKRADALRKAAAGTAR